MLKKVPLIVVLCTALSGAVAFSGCTTNLHTKIAKIPQRARVGVLLVSESGVGLTPTVSKSYIHDALMQNGLIPVALNEVRVPVAIFQRLKKVVEKDAAAAVHRPVKFMYDMGMLLSLQEYFQRKSVQYVLVVYVNTTAFDEDLRAVVVRVTDMVVIGTRFYRYRIMAALWSITPLTVGFSLLVVPFLYLRDSHSANFRLVDQFIKQMTM